MCLNFLFYCRDSSSDIPDDRRSYGRIESSHDRRSVGSNDRRSLGSLEPESLMPKQDQKPLGKTGDPVVDSLNLEELRELAGYKHDLVLQDYVSFLSSLEFHEATHD